MREIDEKYFKTAAKNGISRYTLRNRVRNGWSLNRASTEPVAKRAERNINWMIQGVRLTDAQMEETKKNGLTQSQINTRIFHGWSLEEAIARKIGEKRVEDHGLSRKVRENIAKKMSKERADIAAFAAENGLSYGVVVSYLESGLTLKEIKKQYGMKYEKVPHRWAQCFGEERE